MIQATKILVIDEISMLPGKTLQFINFVCKHVRGSNEPFGGIQVLCVGDFLQLPPVAKTGGYDWAFETDTWHDLGFANVTLQTVHRQADPMFVDVLNQFREGSITKAGAAILKPRVARFPKSDILRLMTHNTQVAKWNAYQLGAIDGESHEIKATFDGATADCDFLRKNLITPESLLIKRQARVMVTSNIAGNGESLAAANGDMGVVVDWSDQAVIVKLDNGTLLPLQAKTWSFDPMNKKSATMTQIPLKLAWATTIHKSQGLTLDNALIDIRATREPGQAYVAISRVRGLSGLHLKDWFSGIWVSPVAKAFHKQIA
jgi:ATP-dependent exoDNAse (exonuclease V) alpha subunit